MPAALHKLSYRFGLRLVRGLGWTEPAMMCDVCSFLYGDWQIIQDAWIALLFCAYAFLFYIKAPVPLSRVCLRYVTRCQLSICPFMAPSNPLVPDAARCMLSLG